MQEGNYRNHQHQRNRSSHRNRGGNRPGGRHGRGQRPLLTAATQAAGMSLVGLILFQGLEMSHGSLKLLLTIATLAFTSSALVSYVAQRLKGKWVEMLSDSFFIAGSVAIILIALVLGDFLYI